MGLKNLNKDKAIHMMKLFASLFMFFGLTANVTASDNIDSLLQNFLNRKEYFKLNRFLNLHKEKCSDFAASYFSIYTANAFNRLQQSDFLIKTVNTKYSKRLTPSMKLLLLKTSIDNSIKLFRYKDAANKIQQLLSKYNTHIDSSDVDEWKNELIIFRLLQNTPPQVTQLISDFTLPYKRDISNLINIPVTSSQGDDDFIFDTGANLSAISESFSKKLKLKVFPTIIKVNSFTGDKIDARIGVAPKLIIGKAEISNVVFVVLPDKSLTFDISPTSKYIINGVIGYPVISQLQELQFLPGNKLFIPTTPQARAESNLALSGLLPAIELITDNTDTLNFHFDTGAGETILYKNYYLLKKESIDSSGTKKVSKIGGAGSVAEKITYSMPVTSFTVLSNTVELKNIRIMTDDTEEYYGNIGQDFIRKFPKMTINFKSLAS